MIPGVWFGEKHSYDDFGFLLQKKTVEEPEPITNYVDIGGRNGPLDLTVAITGYVCYTNRTLTFEFCLPGPRDDHASIMRTFTNYLHGQKLAIIEWEDPGYYYVGRCKVTNPRYEKNIYYFTVECNCEPYKIMIGSHREIIHLSTSNLVNVNDHQWFRFHTGIGTISNTGWYYIDSTGKESSRNFYSVGYLTPVAPGTRLWGSNALGMTSFTYLNTFYIAEYDQYRRFIKKSREITSGSLDYTVSNNCYYVIAGFGMRAAAADVQSRPCLQVYTGSNSYHDYDSSTRYSSFTFNLSDGKEVTPEFCVYGDITLTYEGEEFHLTSGIHKVLSLIMHPGENEIAVKGHGSISVEYQEVSL